MDIKILKNEFKIHMHSNGKGRKLKTEHFKQGQNKEINE